MSPFQRGMVGGFLTAIRFRIALTLIGVALGIFFAIFDVRR